MRDEDVDSAPRLEALRAAASDDADVPETVRRFLAAGAPLEEIRLDARGRWWHEGEPFENRRLMALFHRSLQRTGQGTWILSIPPYTYPVLVDETGHFVDRVEASAEGILLRLLDGTRRPADTGRFYTDGGERILVHLEEGAWARVVGDAYRALLEDLDEEAGEWWTRVGPHRIALRDLPPSFDRWTSQSA